VSATPDFAALAWSESPPWIPAFAGMTDDLERQGVEPAHRCTRVGPGAPL